MTALVEMESFGIAVAAFIVITLVVGVFAGRLVKNSGKRLIVAGKSLPLFMVGTMLAAQAVDGNSTLGNIALVFEFGFWAGAVIPIGLGISILLVSAFYAKPLNKMSMITLPDFYFRRFGNGAEGISGILMIISFLILVAGNLAASGFILEVVFGINYFYGIAISAIVVVIYSCRWIICIRIHKSISSVSCNRCILGSIPFLLWRIRRYAMGCNL